MTKRSGSRISSNNHPTENQPPREAEAASPWTTILLQIHNRIFYNLGFIWCRWTCKSKWRKLFTSWMTRPNHVSGWQQISGSFGFSKPTHCWPISKSSSWLLRFLCCDHVYPFVRSCLELFIEVDLMDSFRNPYVKYPRSWSIRSFIGGRNC